MVFLIIGKQMLHAQDAELIELKRQADSIQRISLRDSLNFDDSMITQIYAIRDSMLNNIQQLREDFNVPDSEKEIKITDLKNQANENIKKVLGDEIYQNYLEMIRKRIKKSIVPNQCPLAGDSDGN